MANSVGYHESLEVLKPETLDVIIGVVERMNLQLATVAGSGIDLAYRKAPAEPPPRDLPERGGEFGRGGVIRRRRPLGERPAEHAFKQQSAHRMRPYRSWPE